MYELTTDTPTQTTTDEALTESRADRALAAGEPQLPGLTIVLPCYDEAANVEAAIQAATRAGERFAAQHEVVVIDDGSRDDTALIAGRLAAADRRVRLVVHAVNRGYGDAVRSGIDAATQPWVLLTDADLQFDLDDLAEFVPRAPHADLIVGRRLDRQDRLARRLNAGAWNWLVRRLFRVPVRDVDCAFKLVRRDLLERCPLEASGAMVSTELIARCAGAGARIEQLPVRHLPRVAGHPTGANPRVVLRAFRELIGLHHDLRTAVG